MATPPTSIDPPFAFTPLTVSKSRAVSNCHSTAPSVVEYARKCPSTDPENTMPGATETGEDWAGLQLGRSPHTGGAADHAFEPSEGLIATSPPPTVESSPPRPSAP